MPINAPTISTHQGYFVMADISGYTHFVAHNDLAHAQGVLEDITSLVMTSLAAPLEFVELEGDAVFMYAPEAAVSDAERLLDIVEVCYAAFKMRVEQMSRNSTCTCSACKAVPSLDLKFVGHYGTYATQHTPRGQHLVGPDVTLVHLMLKSNVKKATGIRAYALLTEAFIERSYFATPGDHTASTGGGLGLTAYAEDIEPFGMIPMRVADLSSCVERHKDRFRESLDHLPIDMEVCTPMDVPMSFLWGYVTQPSERFRWQTDIKAVRSTSADNGRTDIGWQGHCDHAGYSMTHRIMDWQPFKRITMFTTSRGYPPTTPPPCQVDFVFEEVTSATCRLRFQVRLRNCNVFQRTLFKLALPWIRKQWQGHFHLLRRISAEDWAVAKVAAT
ncbi:MAG: DUF2652 domain-containing protein [Candidatus Kapaibacterium sp.]